MVPALGDVFALRDRVLQNWHGDVRHIDDYVEHPKLDGYRAIHIVVVRNGHLVEIQLRTELQHEWAMLVERLEDTHRTSFREGQGSPEIKAALSDLAEAAACADLGQPVPLDVARRITERLIGSIDPSRMNEWRAG